MAPTLRPGNPEAVGMSSRKVGHLSDLARGWVEQEGVQAIVLLAARRGTVVLHDAWGRMGPEADAPPVSVDAVFDTQSIGKLFTATAVLLLVEEGRVGLNRPVSGYVPFLRGEGKDAVLVRHLLTHTSGLRSEDVERFVKEQEGKFQVPAPGPGMHPLWNEYFERRADCPLWKRPGEEMSYLPYGYELLAEIVRRVSAEPFDVFSQRRIFGPLGMKDSSCCQIDFPLSRRVRKPPNPAEQLDALDRARETERIAYGGGGAYVTAYDMAIFGQMLLNGGVYGETRLLSPTTVKAMIRNQIPGVGSAFFDQHFPEASWGLGPDIRDHKAEWGGGLQSPDTFGHLGAGGVEVWVDPRDELIGVFLSATPSIDYSTREWAKYWRNDLFADALTASIVEP